MSDQPNDAIQNRQWPSITGPLTPITPSLPPSNAQSAAGIDQTTKKPAVGVRQYQRQHDGLLFIKQAAFLLTLIGLFLFVFGVVLGTSTVGLAPLVPSAGDNSITICGSPFSPAKQGDTQPRGKILNEYGESLCREKIGNSGNFSITMVALGVAALIAAGVFAGTAVRQSK